MSRFDLKTKLAYAAAVAKSMHYMRQLTVRRFTLELPAYNAAKGRYEVHRHAVYDVTHIFSSMLKWFSYVAEEFKLAGLSPDELKDLLDSGRVEVYASFKNVVFMAVAAALLAYGFWCANQESLAWNVSGLLATTLSALLWLKSLMVKYVIVLRPEVRGFSGDYSPVVFTYFSWRRRVFSLVTIVVYYPAVHKLSLEDLPDVKARLNVLCKGLDYAFAFDYLVQRYVELRCELEHARRLLEHYTKLATTFRRQAEEYLERFEDAAVQVPQRRKVWPFR